MTPSPNPEIRAFFDEPTNTVSYLVWDPETRAAAVIDPVLDYDHASGKVGTASAEALLFAARALDLKVQWVLETHAHADHLTAAPLIKARTGALVGIGEHITDVQAIFRPMFNALDLTPDGRFHKQKPEVGARHSGRYAVDRSKLYFEGESGWVALGKLKRGTLSIGEKRFRKA